MDARKITRQVRLTHWAEAIQERAHSGKTIKQWCRDNGISERKYHYRQRKLKEAMTERITDFQSPEQIGHAISGYADSRPIQTFMKVKMAEQEPEGECSRKKHSSSITTGEYGLQQLFIDIGEIHIKADSTYPPEKLAAILRELVRV